MSEGGREEERRKELESAGIFMLCQTPEKRRQKKAKGIVLSLGVRAQKGR